MPQQTFTLTPPLGGRGALFSYFTNVKDQIIDIATQKGINPEGKTLSSLQVAETPNGYELQTGEGIYFIDRDRGLTKPDATEGNPNLAEVIQDWLDAKGLNINPYAVAGTIHKSGTKLYRSGANSGILSVPLNMDRLNEVFNHISTQYLQNTADDIFKITM